MAHVAEDAICLHRSSGRSEGSTAILAYESDNLTIIPTQMDTIGTSKFLFCGCCFLTLQTDLLWLLIVLPSDARGCAKEIVSWASTYIRKDSHRRQRHPGIVRRSKQF